MRLKAVVDFMISIVSSFELALGRLVDSELSVVVGLLGALLFGALCVRDITRYYGDEPRKK